MGSLPTALSMYRETSMGSLPIALSMYRGDVHGFIAYSSLYVQGRHPWVHCLQLSLCRGGTSMSSLPRALSMYRGDVHEFIA